ncbi:MAG: hypothetical protein AAFU73_13525 [Planctomycetota bacterium]
MLAPLSAALVLGTAAAQSAARVPITAEPAAADATDVTIERGPDGCEVLHVAIGFDVDPEEVLALEWPDRWGPEEGLGGLIEGLRLTGPDGVETALAGTSEASRLEDLDPGRHVLSYTVRQDYEGLPQWGEHRIPGMRPVLQPEFATAIGRTFLPTLPNEEVIVTARIDPERAAFHRPVDAEGRTRLGYRRLADGIFVFGDFRYTSADHDGVQVRQAIRGQWALSDDEIAAASRAVLGHGSRLFDDPAFDQYFVALTALPETPGTSSVIGSGFDESFFILATPNAKAANLTHTIVHEVLHEWIPRRAGRTDEATDPSRAWFIEGFTEYFTQRILLASELITLDQFVANLDAMLQAYLRSSVRDLPAAALNERIFESRETERLPYQRGALLALSWDSALLKRGESGLEQVVAALIDRADRLTNASEVPELTDEAIHRALEARLGKRFTREFAAHIARGALIDPAELTLPAVIELVDDGTGPRLATRKEPCEGK